MRVHFEVRKVVPYEPGEAQRLRYLHEGVTHRDGKIVEETQTEELHAYLGERLVDTHSDYYEHPNHAAIAALRLVARVVTHFVDRGDIDLAEALELLDLPTRDNEHLRPAK